MNDTTLIFETFLMPTLYKTYQYITEYIERVLHIPTLLLNGEGLDDFEGGYADAGFMSANAYLQLQSLYPRSAELIAMPLQPGEHEQDSSPTFFDIIVRKDSGLTSISDLEYATWAYHVGISQVEDWFRDEQGILPIQFHNMVETPSQAQSMRSVLDGKVDASAIEGRLLELAWRNSPHIATQLRVIGTYSYTASPLVVLAAHLEPLVKDRVQKALLGMHQDPFFAQQLREGLIERFHPVSSMYSQPLRRSIEGVNNPPLPMPLNTRQQGIGIG
ncbi:phosphate/phosphite/phosphonate ABC transporter substrate-binding protein [Dictyobacter alpinus]|nr:PhnD/SsuA/transferrin family substrate-binding protein [Dictyobacter alpinus]